MSSILKKKPATRFQRFCDSYKLLKENVAPNVAKGLPDDAMAAFVTLTTVFEMYEAIASKCAQETLKREDIIKLGLLDKDAQEALEEATDEEFTQLVTNLCEISRGLGYA